MNPILNRQQKEQAVGTQYGQPILARAQNYLRTMQANTLTPPQLVGVDGSKWQSGKYDYQAAFDPDSPHPIDFGIFKAGEAGADDPLFGDHTSKTLDAGGIVQAYYWPRFNVDPIKQADHFLEVVRPVAEQQGGIVLWGDVESTDNVSLSTRQSRLLKFTEEVEKEWTTGFYSSKYLWDSIIGNVTWVSGRPFWVAHWTSSSNIYLPMNVSMSDVWFHQHGIWNDYWWCEEVTGFVPDWDKNLGYFGSRDELREAMGITPPPPPTVGNEFWLHGEWKVDEYDGTHTKVKEVV